ncbi:MAG: hypothetical protein ACI9NT_000005 [Bacteroidia bacterium]|jgi:hypothetical protein
MRRLALWRLCVPIGRSTESDLANSAGICLVQPLSASTRVARMIATGLLLLLITTSTLAADRLYRYRNAQGNVVVDYQVPIEAIKGGYEILNDEGMVIRVVPREPTEEEKEANDVQSKLDAAALAEQERLRKWDESLLLRYSTVMDIEAARNRALGDLQIRVSILKGNRRSLKQKVENLQAQAANMERAGMTVNVERLRGIEQMQSEIAATDRAVIDREREIAHLEADFQADIDRFGMLQDVVEMRRTLRSRNTRKP